MSKHYLDVNDALVAAVEHVTEDLAEMLPPPMVDPEVVRHVAWVTVIYALTGVVSEQEPRLDLSVGFAPGEDWERRLVANSTYNFLREECRKHLTSDEAWRRINEGQAIVYKDF